MPQAFSKSSLLNVKEFITEYGDSACRVQDQTGVSALAILAQIALETGWGNKILVVTVANGQDTDSKNLFNIKASPDWTGQTGWANVPEWVNGKYVMMRQYFRVYTSYDDSINDYLKVISTQTLYANAWAVRQDPFKYVNLIAQDGYATDPNYRNVLWSIMTYNIGINESLPTRPITTSI